MRLVIDDGYTLDAATEATVTNAAGEVTHAGLPVVAFRYRPALPEALAEWRYALARATSGRAELDATARLVAGHLVAWDVTDAAGAAVPVTAEAVRKVPDPVLDQIVRAVATWAPRAGADAGNSRPG